jgi:hypothetical protein
MPVTHAGPKIQLHPASVSVSSPTSGARGPIEFPLVTLFGLLVVWASLVIVFTANRLSDTNFHLETSGLGRNNSVLMSLEPQIKILLPFSMFVPHMTPAEALAAVGSYINFNVQPENLDKLETERRNFRYVDQPVYAVLHQLIGKPTLGFILQNNNMLVIPQQLEIKHGATGGREMLWEADLNLTSQRTLVVPSGELPIWLFMRLTGEATEDVSHWNTMQIEVHRGAELLTMTRTMLDEKGNASMSMSDIQTISLRIQRVIESQGKELGRYHINFHYQAQE